MQQVHIFISGSVQGVGYRQFVKSYAKKLGLSGWTRNLSDGRVEIVLQGLKKDIEEMILRCRKGPFLSRVKHVDVKYKEATEEFADFMIRSDA